MARLAGALWITLNVPFLEQHPHFLLLAPIEALEIDPAPIAKGRKRDSEGILRDPQRFQCKILKWDSKSGFSNKISKVNQFSDDLHNHRAPFHKDLKLVPLYVGKMV